MNTIKVKIKKETRVINLNKTDFDTIKEYCDKKALNMPNWMTKIAIEKITEEEYKVDNSLPKIEDVIKQYIGHPEKFEQYINKKFGIIKENK